MRQFVCRRSGSVPVRVALLALGLPLAAICPVGAQERRAAVPDRTALHGATTTQSGSVYLPGVTITVTEPATNSAVAETSSDAGGRFAFDDLKPGTYRVRAVLDGFVDAIRQSVVVLAGRDLELSLDLALAKLAESVTVEASAKHLPLEASIVSTQGGSALELGPIKGDNFQALLPALPGIVRALDGHISIKGASASQSSVQVNAANVTDPSTGNLGFDLPNDAVESVDVLTNPYAAEYGRFSSGVTTLNTARGGAAWAFTPNGFVPRLYRSKDDWWHIMGIRSFRPRFALGGPIVKDKVFLFETVLYRYFRTPMPSLDGEQFVRFSEVKTFSRLDANISPSSQFSATVATFPQQIDFSNLNTFNQSSVSTNFRQSGFNATAAHRATLSGTALLESTAAVKRYNVEVFGQGTAAMTITPEGNGGNFFNRQTRQSTTLQWVESLTMTKAGPVGEHLIKVGSDLLRVGYDGESDSSPVNILRENGSLLERITFGPATTQRVTSTEIAFVAQDQWRMNDRLLLELGGRIDHDGVLERTNLTPRFGVAIGLQPDGKTILRGGIGLFYDRTPLTVGAFQSFEPRTQQLFAANGTTPAGSTVMFVNVSAPDLNTPYSRIWNIEVDQRVNDRWSFKVNHLERNAHREFIVDPTVTDGVGRIRLSSTGQSRYREIELAFKYADGDRIETTVSYVRSRAEGDLNSFDLFFGNQRDPLIRPNQYGLASVDTPHRVLIRGSYALPLKIRFDPLVDWHSGFPYSTVAENQSFIGPRNGAGRYPAFFSFDFSASRPVRIWKYRAEIGVRLFDATNRFNPRDLQGNIASPFFGTFHNPVPRDFQTFVELRK